MRAKNEFKFLAEAYSQVNEGFGDVGDRSVPDPPSSGGGEAPQGMLKPGQLPGGHNAAQQKAGAAIKQAYDEGPSGVREFLNTPEGKDPKVRQFLHKAQEEFDGNAIDDNITVDDPENTKLGQLFPTQNFIDFQKSVAFPLANAKALETAITKKTGHGTISISDNAILDGHHRWSGQFAITPDGVINAVNIDLPGNPIDKLAALQLAIGAIANPAGDHPSAGGKLSENILGKTMLEIKKLILDNVGQEMDPGAEGLLLNDDMLRDIVKNPGPFVEWLKVPAEQLTTNEQVKEAIAVRVATNLSLMKQPAPGQAPDRPDMPQLDHKSIEGAKGLEKIKAGLKAGSLNVVPPFTKQQPAVKESRLRAKDEFNLLAESYNKVLREGSSDPVWGDSDMQWDGIDDDHDPPGKGGYNPVYEEALYAKMLEVVNELKGVSDIYQEQDLIDPNSTLFSTIDKIVSLVGTEGEEEDDKDEEEAIKVDNTTQDAEWTEEDTPF